MAETLRDYLPAFLAGLVVAGAIGLSTAASMIVGEAIMQDGGAFFGDPGIGFVAVAITAGAVLVGVLIGLAAAFTANTWRHGVVGGLAATFVGFIGIVVLMFAVDSLVDDEETVAESWEGFGDVLAYTIPATLAGTATGTLALMRGRPAPAAVHGAPQPHPARPLPHPSEWR